MAIKVKWDDERVSQPTLRDVCADAGAASPWPMKLSRWDCSQSSACLQLPPLVLDAQWQAPMRWQLETLFVPVQATVVSSMQLMELGIKGVVLNHLMALFGDKAAKAGD